MPHDAQAQGTTRTGKPEEPGLLITWVHGYNLLVALIFGGRRGALNSTLAAASGARPGDRALDIGCGPGRFAGRLATAVGPKGEVVGVDPSEPMIAYAARHAGRRANCRFEIGQAQALTLPDAAFDVVTSTFAMHHIPEDAREAALGEMHRVLRPGGRLMIADALPTGRVTRGLTRTMARLMPGGRHAGDGHAGHGDGHHHGTDPMSAADVRQYADAIRRAGFDTPRFTDAPPWTRYLTATKPA